jgi:hypothetical protein
MSIIPRKPSDSWQQSERAHAQAGRDGAAGSARKHDTQPPNSGGPGAGRANQGSPAASVMKQFAKTGAESNGRNGPKVRKGRS